MTKAAIRGEPHVRFDERASAPEAPRRGSLLYKSPAILFCAIAGIVCPAQTWAADARWSTSVNDGIYTNDANWTIATSPWSASAFSRGPSETVFFDLGKVTPNASGEIRVAIEGNVTDYNRLCVRDVKKDVPLVFSVTNNASWYKGPGSMYDTYGFNLSQNSGQTGDNLSIRPAANNTTEPCFLMRNALLSYTINSDTGNRIAFSHGLWNWYDPSGDASESPANTMYVGYGGNGVVMPNAGTRFDVAANATLRGNNLKVAQHTMDVAGGDHVLFGSLEIGLLQQGTNSTFAMRGGTLGVTNGVIVGATASTIRPVDNSAVHCLALSGAAAMDVNKSTKMSDHVNAHSRLVVSDFATYRTKGFVFGSAASAALVDQCYMAEAIVEGDARFITWNGGDIGLSTSARMTLKDRAVFEQEGDNQTSMGSRSALHLTDSAQMLIGGPLTINGNVSSEVVVEGNAALKIVDSARGTVVGNGHRLTIGGTATPRVRLTLRDNAQIRTYDQVYIYGKDTLVDLSGGVSEWLQPIFFGTADPAGQCRMRISGGMHYIGRPEAVNKNNSVYVGYTTAGTKSTLEVAGGTLVLSTAGTVTIAQGGVAVATTGRVDLVGGVFRGKLAGGTSAACRGGKGHAELYANGGTLETLGAAAAAYITNMDEAVLGEKGLTFNSTVGMNDPRADIKQAFTDEPGKTGRFVKTGPGVVRLYNASSHGETAVANGTAMFMSGVGQFGRSLVVTNNATLWVEESVSATRLALGDSVTSGTLKLEAGAVVTLTGDGAFSAPRGILDYEPAAVKGSYTVFRLTGEVDRSAFLSVSLAQSSATLHYAFQFEEDGGDTLVRLVTYTDEDVAPATWQGMTGVFETPGNWQEGSAPGVASAAVFGADAAAKDVTMAHQTTVDNMEFQGGDYILRSSEALKVFGIAVSADTAEVLAPLFSVGSLSLDVAAGAQLTLGGAFEGNFSAVKTGKGLLSVDSASTTASSDWTLSGGTTEFAHPEAIACGSGSIVVGHATARFTGGGETASGITVAAGAGQAAVIDVAADVSVNGGFTTTSGGTLKTGAATLTVNFPAGSYNLAKDDLGVGANALPGNTSPIMQPVPADGEVASLDGIAGFTVREGAVRLVGAGADVTTVNQDHWTLVGPYWTNNVANAVLELSNLTYNNPYTYYKRTCIGLRTAGSCVDPTLRVNGGALFKTQGLVMGSNDIADRHWHPTFEISNATARIGSSLYVGQQGRWHPYCHPTVRVLSGADVYVESESMSLGILLGGNGDVTVDGGVLRTKATNSGIIYSVTASGAITVRNGGELCVTGFKSDIGRHTQTTNHTIRLDNGTLELLASGSPNLVDPQKRQVEICAGGGTVRVDGSSRFVFTFPITGPGALTKTGSGELVIAAGREITLVEGPVGTWSESGTGDSGLVTGQWGGLTTVAAGVMTFEETSSIAGRSFAVADGATLDLGGYSGGLVAVSGCGTVRNATVQHVRISAPRPDETPVAIGLDVALPGMVVVDFGVPHSEVIARPSGPVPVARLGSGAVFNAAGWRARNCGYGNSATFDCTDGVVYATFCNKPGAMLIVF